MNKEILVLGSEGLIGTALCENLKKSGHKLTRIDLKLGLDINDESIKYYIEDHVKTCDFVYFLAFDVGGANYLSKYEHTYKFISNNIKMMERIFELIGKYNKKFVFISSMMTKMPQSTYGLLKSIGERYTKSLDGVSIRFWNVYGPEKIEQGKNHVITDFIISALTKGHIKCMTDGSEVRQFIHTDSAAEALSLVMNNYEKVKTLASNDLNCVDITNNSWVRIATVANQIAKETGVMVEFSENKDKVQKDLRIESNTSIIESLGWFEKISLFDGIESLVKLYGKKQ